MTASEIEVAVLKSQLEDLRKDVEELQKQRNVGVIAVLSLAFNAAFGALTGGAV